MSSNVANGPKVQVPPLYYACTHAREDAEELLAKVENGITQVLEATKSGNELELQKKILRQKKNECSESARVLEVQCRVLVNGARNGDETACQEISKGKFTHILNRMESLPSRLSEAYAAKEAFKEQKKIQNELKAKILKGID